MKNLICLLPGLFLLFSGNTYSQNEPKGNQAPAESSINIVCTDALFTLTKCWTDEYSRLNPKQTFKINRTTDLKTTNIWSSGAELAFVSNEDLTTLKQEESWKIVVGRDVFVPVFNTKNPFFPSITQKGVTVQNLLKLFNNEPDRNWNVLLGNEQKALLNFYLIDKPSMQQKLSSFLNSGKLKLNGTYVADGKAMILAIQKDPNSIGFCRLTDIVDPKTQNFVENISILPIDKNENGKIDYVEKIYTDYNALTRGIWIGKYPKTLFDNIYSISSAKPAGEKEIAFLKWVLSDGQNFLAQNELSSLIFSERQSQADLFNNPVVVADSRKDHNMTAKAILFLVAFFTIAGFVLYFVSRKEDKKRLLAGKINDFTPVAFNENSLSTPKGLYYDKTHTWIFMEENGILKTGIDEFFTRITGTVSKIEMKNTGEKIRKGEQLFSIIHQGKKLHIYSPVSGTIVKRNEMLLNDSSLLNSSPFTAGWIYQVEPTDWMKEISFLYLAEKYKTWINNEFTRLKDFISFYLNSHTVELSQVVLQDGGELKENMLADLGPEIWEDFQTKFIDNSTQQNFCALNK